MYVMRYPKFSILYNKFREARKIQKLDFVQLKKPSFFAFFAHILRILLFVLHIFCAFYARVLLCNKPSLTLLGETYIWFTKYTKYGDYGIVYRDHTYYVDHTYVLQYIIPCILVLYAYIYCISWYIYNLIHYISGNDLPIPIITYMYVLIMLYY